MSTTPNSKTNPLESVLAIQTGLVFLGIWLGNKQLFLVALSVGLLSLIWSGFAYYLSKFWLALAKLLSMIVPNIIFSIFYFLFFTPFSLMKRLFSRKNEMDIRDPKRTSMLKGTPRKFSPEQFENTW